LDQWEGPEGEKKSRMRVRADRVQFLSRGGAGGRGAGAKGEGPRDRSEGNAPKSAPNGPEPAEDDVPF
jgi:single-strand DNA-binding protein